jgi:hypothetical protein
MNNNIPSEALTDTYINNYLKHIKSFIGCIPKDKLKHVKINSKKEMSCIVNLDDSTGPGTHWVLCYYKNNLPHSYYIDSFGLKPPKDVVNFLNKYKKPIFYNDANIQSLDSNRCGAFCIDMIEWLDKDFTPTQVLKTYTPYPSQFNENKSVNKSY